jgi:MFS family permease
MTYLVSRMISSLASLLRFDRQVWIQAIARAGYQAGQGLLQFYVPLIFVNQVGLSATAVGIGLGSASIAGVVGHFLGGTLADTPVVGRKKTLLLAAGLSIAASIVLSFTHDLPLLITANLLLGTSMGFYWTAADAAVMDVTSADNRPQAFSVLGVSENLGLGAGILGGGALLPLFDNPRELFLAGSLVFLFFLILVQSAVPAEQLPQPETTATAGIDASTNVVEGWRIALSDRLLWVFLLVNSLFTTYVALVNNILPLYFTNFVPLAVTQAGGNSASEVANLFTWGYIGFAALLQIPAVQILGSFGWARALIVAMLLWGGGFFCVWGLGSLAAVPVSQAIAVLAVLAIATVIYKPFSVAFIAELAPVSLRGTYTAIGYQCWAIGYFIGPTIGGWAMDQVPSTARQTWLVVALSSTIGLIILTLLARRHSTLTKILKAEDLVAIDDA